MRSYLLGVLLAGVMALPGVGVAQSDDDAALGELQQFMNDPAARSENANGDPQAAQAESLFRGYPPYAQQELNAIVMMIMNESGEGATRHTDAYQTGGAQGALGSFSPAVRARIAALQTRLEQDPSFNTPENLQRMHSLFPAFLSGSTR